MIFLLIVGSFLTVVGLLSVLSKRFDDWIDINVRPRFEPDPTKRASSRSFNRYWGGVGLAITGLGLLALYAVSFL
jgi:hypothetical protein